MSPGIAILISAAWLGLILIYRGFLSDNQRESDRVARKNHSEGMRSNVAALADNIESIAATLNDVVELHMKNQNALHRLADAQMRMARHVAPDAPEPSSEEWMKQEKEKARRKDARPLRRGAPIPRRPQRDILDEAFTKAKDALDATPMPDFGGGE